MVQDSKFAIRVLEKIGAPLAAAIESVQLNTDDNETESAKLIAQMMGQATQVSITLNDSLNVTENEEQADSTRLALAALAAKLIANFYKQNERVPEDADIKRMIKAQEAVLAFAENFTPAADGKSRLTTIDHDAPLFDETQGALIILQAMGPVINAIAEFPFGLSETKLLQDVSARLQKDSSDIASAENKLGQMMVLKSLAEIYAECHRAETARLSQGGDEQRSELSLDPIWAAYDTKLEMVKAIAGTDSIEANSTSGSVAPPLPQESAQEPEQQQSQPQTKPEPQAPEQPAQTAAPAAGPMGFFKPGAKTDETPSSEPQQPASAPAQAAPPQTEAHPEPSESTTPEATADNASSTPPSNPPSGPMGFFKPGAKKPEDGGDA